MDSEAMYAAGAEMGFEYKHTNSDENMKDLQSFYADVMPRDQERAARRANFERLR